jgi:hypothetical protein
LWELLLLQDKQQQPSAGTCGVPCDGIECGDALSVGMQILPGCQQPPTTKKINRDAEEGALRKMHLSIQPTPNATNWSNRLPHLDNNGSLKTA